MPGRLVQVQNHARQDCLRGSLAHTLLDLVLHVVESQVEDVGVGREERVVAAVDRLVLDAVLGKLRIFDVGNPTGRLALGVCLPQQHIHAFGRANDALARRKPERLVTRHAGTAEREQRAVLPGHGVADLPDDCRPRIVLLQPVEHAVVEHQLPDDTVPAGLHDELARPAHRPPPVVRLDHRHHRLLEQLERLLATPEPVVRLEQLHDPVVIALGHGRHDRDRRPAVPLLSTPQLVHFRVAAKQPVVEILTTLHVPDQMLQQRPAAVREDGRRQAVARLLALQPEPVPGATQRINLRHLVHGRDTRQHRRSRLVRTNVQALRNQHVGRGGRSLPMTTPLVATVAAEHDTESREMIPSHATDRVVKLLHAVQRQRQPVQRGPIGPVHQSVIHQRTQHVRLADFQQTQNTICPTMQPLVGRRHTPLHDRRDLCPLPTGPQERLHRRFPQQQCHLGRIRVRLKPHLVHECLDMPRQRLHIEGRRVEDDRRARRRRFH